MSKKTVLFICTGNSARSQLAEGLLRHMAGDRYDVASAGTAPKGLHPRTAEVMREVGIDVSDHTSKDLEPFIGRKYDYVVTVCDRAKEQCPVFPGAQPMHWSFDDPADAPVERQPETFRRVRDEIAERLRLFVSSSSG